MFSPPLHKDLFDSSMCGRIGFTRYARDTPTFGNPARDYPDFILAFIKCNVRESSEEALMSEQPEQLI